MTHRVLLLTVLLSYVSLISTGQRIPVELKKWLSSEETSKIKKSQELVEQGKSVLFEFNRDSTIKLEDSYENLTIDFVVNKKTGRQLIDAKDYFFNGYKGQLDIYQTYIDYYIRKNKDRAPKLVVANNDTITKMASEAEMLLKKSSAKGNVKVAGDLIHQANLKLYRAVILSQLTMIDIQNINFSSSNNNVVQISETKVSEEQKDENNVVPKASVETKSTNNLIVTSPPVVANNNVKNLLPLDNNSEDEIEKEAEPQIYYTIQILADKKPISKERLNSVYKGDLPIVQNQGGGWYRYSIGKFTNYMQAKKALSSSKVTGYIVAYNKSERITITKAKELLGK